MRIAQRNIPDYDDMTENDQKKAMRSLLRVRMDREQLLSIDFVFFPSLTHIYLGHNKLSFLPQLPVNLCFLVINNNLFAKMAGIQHLKKLQLLDVSSNQLDEFVPSDYPKSLEYLIMEGNICSKLADYRLKITYHFPNIQEIDQIPPSRLEKRLAFQAFGTM
jgi:Leucine-rich repeat (LRR) protein